MAGLEVRDRLWLKITIPQAFIGEYKTLPYKLQARILPLMEQIIKQIILVCFADGNTLDKF